MEKTQCNHSLKNGVDYCKKCEVYKESKEALYHIFSDGIDEWLESKEEALKLGDELYKSYGCSRVHKEVNFCEIEGIYTDFICIYSKGSFPF